MKVVQIRLHPLSPFRLDLTVWALRRRPRNLIDRWDGQRYSRILTVDGTPLHLAIRQTRPSNQPEIQCLCTCVDHAPRDGQVAVAVKKLLGLDIDINGFEQLAARHKRLGALAARFVGFRPPRFPTVFEAAVNAICCQQLSLEAGLELLNRLSSRTGIKFKGAHESFFGPPEPRKLTRLALGELRELGFSRNKAKALLELGHTFARDNNCFEHLVGTNDESAMDRLMQLKSIGRWSAEYVLLRGLGRLSVFPGDDIAAANNLSQWLGIRRGRRSLGYDEIRERLRRWHPFQGMIYFYLLLGSLAARGWLDTPAAADPTTVTKSGLNSASIRSSL